MEDGRVDTQRRFEGHQILRPSAHHLAGERHDDAWVAHDERHESPRDFFFGRARDDEIIAWRNRAESVQAPVVGRSDEALTGRELPPAVDQSPLRERDLDTNDRLSGLVDDRSSDDAGLPQPECEVREPFALGKLHRTRRTVGRTLSRGTADVPRLSPDNRELADG